MSKFPTVAILAGGLATRLRPLTERVPKALIPINDRPFIAHQLELLKASGASRVVICAAFLGQQIAEYVQNGKQFGLEVEYSFDGPTLLGTGGAIRNALPLLDPEFFVLYGDSYLECSYGAILDAFRASGKRALMTVFLNDGRWDASNVEFKNGTVRAYSKRQLSPAMRHIDYGLGVFHRKAFADIAPYTRLDLADLYTSLLGQHELAGFEVPERFYEIGSPAGIEDLTTHLNERSNNDGVHTNVP